MPLRSSAEFRVSGQGATHSVLTPLSTRRNQVLASLVRAGILLLILPSTSTLKFWLSLQLILQKRKTLGHESGDEAILLNKIGNDIAFDEK